MISLLKFSLFIKNFRDGAILDQQHLKFLADISSRNLGLNLNEPSVTEPLERDTETTVESK